MYVNSITVQYLPVLSTSQL